MGQSATSSRCLVEDCDSNDPVKGCKVALSNHYFGPIACEYGRFVTFVTSRFSGFGKWRFRSIGSGSDVLVATLKGKYGRVEVWGGLIHRAEVWAIPKGTDGCLMGTLLNLETVEMACSRVGIQRQIV